MRKFQLSLVAVLSLCVSNLAVAQDTKAAKKEYSSAMKFAKIGDHKNAILGFDKAIAADPKFLDAYTSMALSHEAMTDWALAVADYKAVFKFIEADNKELKDLYLRCGSDLLVMQEYKDAIEMFNKTIEKDATNLTALQQRAYSKLKLKDFTGSVEDCDKALAVDKNNHTTYFYKGCAVDGLMSNQLAEMLYQKAIENMLNQKSNKEPINQIYKPYYFNLGIVQRKLGKLDDALKNLNSAWNLDQNDDKIYYEKGLCYFAKNDYQTAITEFTKAIVINDKNANAFTDRGYANKKLGQFTNAITDFTRAIVLNDEEPRTFTGRGSCYFEIAKYIESLKDLERASKLAPNDKEITKLLSETKQKIYEINRESIVPSIVLMAPESDAKNRVNIPDDKTEMTFSGKIKDESAIKTILIDGHEAFYDKEDINPSFNLKVSVAGKEQVTITATDVYNNAAKEIYSLNKTETVVPIVKLTTPAATPDLEIYLASDNPNLFFEGEVNDQSTIKSVTIEGTVASFNPGDLNPKFSANLNILNKDTIHIVVTDMYGNTGRQNYFIDREASAAALSNPMGRTWAVFVDNTNYQNLSALQGTTADVTKMRAALASYRIDKTIIKKDMSKKDMERFFSIELRDMLRDNQINSVLVWYSGHGKFMNDVGYWIPVDAVKDDEFTYYSLNNLKASLQSYKNVQHHLVISDACETGPAFYLAMRSTDKPKECGQWDYAKYKSAQVLTSSNKEKSSDNSIFATTFATALSTTTDQCVSIETIAEKVKTVVKKNQAQTPKFGNISGIDDGGGTFFFIKK